MTPALRTLAALAAGLLFGTGLSLSGMVNPARVTGFLNLAGDWDPSLIFVLGGAVIVAFAGVAVQRRMRRPVLEDRFHLPPPGRIDRRLIGGSALFGLGWGLAGLCPGPAIATLSMGIAPVAVFVIAMAAGMILHDRWIAPRG